MSRVNKILEEFPVSLEEAKQYRIVSTFNVNIEGTGQRVCRFPDRANGLLVRMSSKREVVQDWGGTWWVAPSSFEDSDVLFGPFSDEDAAKAAL